MVGGRGGIVGFNGGIIKNSYYTNDQNDSNGKNMGDHANGGTKIDEVQLKSLATFAGWDISAEGGAGKTWRIYEGQTAPLLTAFMTAKRDDSQSLV